MTSKICFKYLLLSLLAVFVTSCKIYYPSQETAYIIKANNAFKADTSVILFYKPYKDSLDKIMKVRVAEISEDLTKKLPESSLGNMMADILKIKAEEYTGNKIDAAILNYGGIRIPSLTKGNLMIEHAYFLMPFDNYIVEQVLTGQQLSDFCDSIAVKKGWPVAGISFQIQENKAVNIQVNNEPISINKKYNIALSDYLANGGDGMTFLKSVPQIQTGKLYRNAIIEYWQQQAKLGKMITSKIENRISYAK
jgi:2',3'-cyclic-nucleotide 2'-phosphodiesterase (5'-nucleotidase family)